MADRADFESAISEFERYLSDQVAPLMVVDEVSTLLGWPAAEVAARCAAWIGESSRLGEVADLADRLMHVVRKLAQMGEFDLVARPALAAYLNDFGQELVGICPPGDRSRLVASLIAFGESLTRPGALLEGRERQETRPTSRRMAVFLDQLNEGVQGERREEVASAFMATAALGAGSRAELDESLAPLREVGIDPASQNVLNSIARSLPGWGVIQGSASAQQAGAERLGAMRQIVTLGEDDEEITKRFREMVHAAIDQFNASNTGRAESILRLAIQMIDDGRVKPVFVENLRRASAYLNKGALRSAAERPESFAALRTILSFFTSLSPEGLVASLLEEANDETARRDLESLLAVHGSPARDLALGILGREGPTRPTGYLVSLLRVVRRIPRSAEAGMVLSEADVLVRFAGRGADPLVATQAIYGLGQLIGDRAGRALIGLLRTYEGLLSRAERASRDAEELSELLARTCGALAQNGTVGGIEALTGHGLKLDEALGDCSARLAEASRVDFAAYPDLMKRLLDTLRGELPRSVLGIRLRKDLGRGVSLTRALSGTSAPEVRQLFETIVRTHGDQEIGEVAQRAILAWNEKAHPAETSTPSTLAGDLGFFGLPMLLQTLEQGSMTGCLSLMDRTGAPRAQVWLKRGEMVTATFRHLAGESAMYELLIRPFPGTFAFVHRGDGPAPGPLGTQKINTLVFEGVIRHDERQRAAALVGDTARLLPTGQPRSPTPNETADLGDALWEAVEGGATPAECEASMPYDSGQIRGLLAAWVEMEALQVA